MPNETTPNGKWASEENSATGERQNEQDSASDIVRERLDGAAPTGLPARGAAWLGRRIEERRLTAWQKAMRVGMIAFVIAATLFALLGGPTAALNALQGLYASLRAPKPPVAFAADTYTLAHLPPAAQHLPRISLSPVAGSANEAYACWIDPFKRPGAEESASASGIVDLSFTDDGGATWTPVSMPSIFAQDCTAVANTSANATFLGGSAALVILRQGNSANGQCPPPALYAVEPGAGSDVLAPIAWPASGVADACDIHFALVGDALYAWSTQPLLLAPPAGATGRLIVSRDGGATWRAADQGLDDATGLDVVGFQAGGRILADVPDVSGPRGAEMLAASVDYGARWKSYGDLPGAFPQVYATTNPNTGWGRLYVSAESLTNGAPTGPANVLLATATLGSRWASLALPPMATGTLDTSNSRQPVVIGVGPAGSLEVERGIVSASDSQLAPARRVWLWSPDRGEWLLDPDPTFGNEALYGWSWGKATSGASEPDQIMWVSSLQLGIPPTLRLFTKRYPAVSVWHVSA